MNTKGLLSSLTHREGLVEEEEMVLDCGRCWGLSGLGARLGCRLLEVREGHERESAKPESAEWEPRELYIGEVVVL